MHISIIMKTSFNDDQFKITQFDNFNNCGFPIKSNES